MAPPATPSDLDKPVSHPMPGGAAGVVATSSIPTTPQLIDPNEPGRQARAKEFMIVDGPRDQRTGNIRFMDQGYGVLLRPGKIVTSATHDLDLMRRQGLRLDPMPDPTPPVEEERDFSESPPSEGDQIPAE